MTAARHTLLRLIMAIALLSQMALPYAQAHAAANGVDLAALICNPSGRIVSVEARTALTELLGAIGEDDRTDTPPDCERCVTPHAALPSVAAVPGETGSFGRSVHQRPVSRTLGASSPRGPPCGTRAPPAFV